MIPLKQTSAWKSVGWVKEALLALDLDRGSELFVQNAKWVSPFPPPRLFAVRLTNHSQESPTKLFIKGFEEYYKKALVYRFITQDSKSPWVD